MPLEWESVGTKIWQSSWIDRPPFAPSEIAELARNPHLAHHINTLIPQIFPAPPQVHVVDQDGNEPNPDLSRAISDSAADTGLYASMRRAYIDCMLYGCAVRSVSVTAKEDGKYVRIAEIRDLPAASFANPPQDGMGARDIVPNSLMPGLRYRDGKPVAYQTDPYTQQNRILKNWDVICDPDKPQPFGEAYCMPIYPILDSIAIAEAALDMAVQRRGSPALTLKVKDDLPASLIDKVGEITNKGAEFVRKWGMNSGGILPRGIEPAAVSTAIIDGQDARDRLQDLDALLDSFFSPTSALSPGRADTQSLFGASQQSRAQIWRAHIAGQQAWIEKAYEQMLENGGLLTANGCPDEWHLEIRFERPAEYDINTRRLSELGLAIQAGVIGRSELRSHLDSLDLQDEIPADLVGGNQQAPQPIGNVAAKTADEPEFLKNADEQDDYLIDALGAYTAMWRSRFTAWLESRRAAQNTPIHPPTDDIPAKNISIQKQTDKP